MFSTPLGLASSIAAAGCAFSLVMFFEAVFAGEAEQIVAYVEHADADIWVMQRGVSNMHMSTSYLYDWKATQIADVPGVASAEPILYLNSVVETGGKQWFSYVVGLDVPGATAGPWAMVAGKVEPGIGEAVVPDVLARMSDVGLGDKIRITDQNFEIVGLSDGTFSIANPVFFITKTDLEDIMTSLDITSFVLVKAEPGVNLTDLVDRIESNVEKVHALPAKQFVINDRQMALQMGAETIALMTVIGGALAVLLVAFTIYSQITRQRRELAIAKALGVTNKTLYLTVAVQACVITLASVVFA
ncbi:MAG: ABC transporter permease, partial [Pseudomonadales bacterium]